ncbi:protein-L-isoaspartate(D-aspartate) O-methyltransferase [Trichloromonas sp.]|uniref:protein-L-isoaspartate(D-aspartate) O-methyltransferase n=1 Tax=Trichloromonas sp. TaxID=3069249 RepID=UPI002A422B2B|nr:protein-L-isoaspartate(D-aspartate) O-methyltransferase [Trichloromonas sp.]
MPQIGIQILLVLCLTSLAHAELPDPYAAQRQKMVETQMVARGIEDPLTLKALAEVPRHLFVDESRRSAAYLDTPLPIGYGQTISQPFMVAFMTEVIRPRPGRKILEIGTGSGYQAAVLAACGAEVYSIEIIPPLAERSTALLRELGYRVETRAGDGFSGWPEAAPFDAIIVTAAAEFIPPPLIDQLKDGGLMVIPVGTPFQMQTLMLVEKRDGKTRSRSLMPVRFVPLRRSP